MAKRGFFIAVWMVIFFIGSAILFGFVSSPFRITNADILGPMVSMLLAGLGFVLGLFEKLPGTRRPSRAQDT